MKGVHKCDSCGQTFLFDRGAVVLTECFSCFEARILAQREELETAQDPDEAQAQFDLFCQTPIDRIGKPQEWPAIPVLKPITTAVRRFSAETIAEFGLSEVR